MASLSEGGILGLMERLRALSSPVSTLSIPGVVDFFPLKLCDVTPGRGKTLLDGEDADAVDGR